MANKHPANECLPLVIATNHLSQLPPLSKPHETHNRTSKVSMLLSAILILGAGCNRDLALPATSHLQSDPGESASSISFRDITSETNVDAVYRNGEEAEFRSIVESLGGGVAVFDYDQDGYLDFYFPQGGTLEDDLSPTGHAGTLYRQIDFPTLRQTTHSAGVAERRHYSHGAAAADYDQDGFIDLLITGYGGLTLYRNSGDGTFELATESALLHDQQWSSSAAWGDVSGDNIPDLYIAHYVDWSPLNHPVCGGPSPTEPDVCPPRRFSGLNDTLYISRGDGTFEDVSTTMGLLPEGKGLGVLIANLDDDRNLDIYVANDTVENFLYLNDGAGRISEQGMLRGVAVDHDGNANGSMGISLFDADRNGTLDLWVTNYEAELFALYLNQGSGQFIQESMKWGLNRLESLYVGFGTVAADFDLDADEDIAVANGHVILFPSNAPVKQEPLILENQRSRFRQIPSTDQPLLQTPRRGRGLAVGDFNRDGLPDLVFANLQEPCSFGLNQTVTTGSSLSIRLIGTDSARQPTGAIVRLRSDQGEQVRQLTGGGIYLSTSDEKIHFGIAAGTNISSITLEISWPGGDTQQVSQSELASVFASQTRLHLNLVEHGQITSGSAAVHGRLGQRPRRRKPR